MLQKDLAFVLLAVAGALPVSAGAEPGKIFDDGVIDAPVGKKSIGPAPTKAEASPSADFHQTKAPGEAPTAQPSENAGQGHPAPPLPKPAWKVGYKPSPAVQAQGGAADDNPKVNAPAQTPEKKALEVRENKPELLSHAAGDEQKEWALGWRDCAKYYVGWKGEFYSFAKYDRNYPSSAMIENKRMTEKSYSGTPSLATLRQSYKDETGQDKKRVLQKDSAEVFAAVSLMPQIADGEYGWIHSGQVVRIVSADEVVLNQLWLVDGEDLASQERKISARLLAQDVADFRAKVEDVSRLPRIGGRPPEHRNNGEIINQYTVMQREAAQWWFAERSKARARQSQAWGEDAFAGYEWHVLGFKTEKMKEGMRWPSGDKGIQLAILVVTNHSVYAAPLAFLEKGLSEVEMLEMLGKRGLTKADFASLAKEARRRDSKNWLLPVINAIDKGEKALVELPKQNPAAPVPQKPDAKPGVSGGNDVELAQ